MRSKKKSQVESSALHGPVHKHSRFAKYLLASMAVGRLRKDDEDEHQAQVLSQDGSTKSKSNTLQRPHSIVQTSASVRENEHDALHSLQRQAKPAIFADHFRTYTMSNKTLITAAGAKYPVYHLRFDFDRVDEKFRVKPGQSVLFQFVDEEGKVVTRSYTPLRCDNEGGIDFFIKMYGGEMTKHLLSCRSIRMRGPVHSMDLLNRYGDNGCWKVLGLIAGGTGLSLLTNPSYFQTH
ncbi:hypothetical protein BC829DRAFT_410477 [Chytridium lagenaria]|nr:hypothetical protein BC829DRAFT_410477 [Chytridium lagenaria]